MHFLLFKKSCHKADIKTLILKCRNSSSAFSTALGEIQDLSKDRLHKPVNVLLPPMRPMCWCGRWVQPLNETKSKFRTSTLDMLWYRISHNQVKSDPQRLQPLLDLPLLSTSKELKRVSGMFSYYSKSISKFSEKASPLLHASTFSIDDDALNSFQRLKDDSPRLV